MPLHKYEGKQDTCRLGLTSLPMLVACTPTVMEYEVVMPRIQLLPLLLFSIQCSRNCSGGFKIREVQCMDSLDHHRSLRPFHCQFLAGAPPPLSMSCNLEPCGEWQVEPWSQVWHPEGTCSISKTESNRQTINCCINT